MIRLLHLGTDDKFFPRVFRVYKQKSCQPNRAIAFCWEKRISQTYIIDNDEVICMHRKSVIKEIKQGNYDVILIHGLNVRMWEFVHYIPNDKILIWISYGYDIYSPGPFGIDYKLIPIETLLPQTKKIIKEVQPFIVRMKYFFAKVKYSIEWLRNRSIIIERTDFFQPVLHVEYEMMKCIKGFRAKEYFSPFYNPSWLPCKGSPIQCADGSIQLSNSAGEQGNHIDVWDSIKNYIPREKQVIIPLSYGNKRYADYVKRRILSEHKNTKILESFLPPSDYYDIVGKCTYFVHGALRQHAMANVFMAISEGRKVFLYRDSIIYRYLIERGFVVFTIEEIDHNSFKTPLSIEEHKKNVLALEQDTIFYQQLGKDASEILNI